MNIEEKYLSEKTYPPKEHSDLMDFADDIDRYGSEIKKLIFMNKITGDEIEKRKDGFLKMRNKAKSTKFKVAVVDIFINFLTEIQEGYYTNIDTSREGT